MRSVRWGVMLFLLIASTSASSNDRCALSREGQIEAISKIIQSAQPIVEKVDPVPVKTAEWLQTELRESVQYKDSERFLSLTYHPSYHAWGLRKDYSAAKTWLEVSQQELQLNSLGPDRSKRFAAITLLKAIKAFNGVGLSMETYQAFDRKQLHPSLSVSDYGTMKSAEFRAMEQSIDLLACMLAP